MENLDLKAQLDESAPVVIAVVLVLGFLLLLIALQAPLISLLGTLATLLSTAAAFGVARMVFQEGLGSGLLGFESQGFLDAWAPVFFFAVFFTFALSGPLPPKEMGVVLGVAVLLDAFLVRLVLLPVLLRLTGKAAW